MIIFIENGLDLRPDQRSMYLSRCPAGEGPKDRSQRKNLKNPKNTEWLNQDEDLSYTVRTSSVL